MKKQASLFIWILFCLCPGVHALSPQKYYVKESGFASGSALSWDNASNDLQAVINSASVGDTVFVAGGRYFTPDTNNEGFIMREGVNVYGGFSGQGGVSYVHQMDTTLYKTYLDGDNKTRVVTQPQIFGTSTEWGGFIVCNGNLDDNNTYGGGVLLRKGGKIRMSSIINNATHASETALGGGIYNIEGTVESCIVRNNYILGGLAYGAGIFNQQGIVLNCFVSYNDAEANAFFSNVVAAGGGIYNQKGNIINTISSKNSAYAYAIVAAYSSGAGIYNHQGSIVNSTVVDNMSDATADAYTYSSGAGIYNQGDCRIVNSIVWNNKVDTSTNNIYNNGVTTYHNSLVEGKTADEIGAGQSNMDGTVARLLFVDLVNENYRLLPYSDAINSGDDSQNSSTFDVDGNIRKYGVIDIGAYEYQGEKLNAQVEMTTSKVESSDIRFRIAGIDAGTIVVNFGDGIPVAYEIDTNPKEITGKVGSAKTVSVFTAVYTPFISHFECRNDSLVALNIVDNKIAIVDCSNNLLRISSLPEKQEGWTTYIYHPQKEMAVKSKTFPSDTIDLSAELVRNGIITAYQWKSKNQSVTLVEGVDYLIDQGVTTFLKSQTDSVYCEMTNALFPDLILRTNKIKVHKVSPVISIDPEQITYTGENIYIRPAYQNNTVNNIPLTLTYRYVSESGWDKPYAVNVGEYKVIAYFDGDGNHEAVTSNVVTLVIKKATPSILLTSKVVPYTGSAIVIDKPPLEGSTTVSTLASGLQYRYVGYKNTQYESSTKAPTEVGTYKVIVSSSGNANHESVSKSILLTISNNKFVASLSDREFVYDGQAKTLTPYIGDPGQNLTVKYIYEGVLYNETAYGPTSQAPVSAGVYTVEAVMENVTETVSAIANLTIKRKEPVFSVENKTVSYTGSPISCNTLSVEPSSGAIYMKTYKGKGNTLYEESSNAPTNVGTYSVNVVFAGSNNYYPITQRATLSIVDKGNSAFIMPNKKVVYTGTSHTVDPLTVLASDNVQNITYMYSGLNYPVSQSAPVNAGDYVVTTSIETDGVMGLQQVQSLLTIEKADQLIQFDQQLFQNRQLVDGQFDITASTNSGQTVTFSSGNTNIANIASANRVVLTGLGVTAITAQAAGSQNYKAAPPVTRTLNVTSSDVSIHDLLINGQPHNINNRYIVDCGYVDDFLDVVIETGLNTVLSIDREFTVDVSKAIVTRIDFTVTSQDGKTTQNYSLTIEKRFKPEDIIVTRTNNVFIAMNMLDSRSITSYKWYKKALGRDTFEEVGQGNTYTTPSSAVFDPADIYYLEIRTSNGEVLRSCEFSPVLKSMDIKIYPNPVLRNQVAYIEADIDDDMLTDAVTDIYSLSGEHVLRFPLTGRTTLLPTWFSSGLYIVKVSSKGTYTRSTRLMINN